jgi:DeoR family galactitol utilization operon repressor
MFVGADGIDATNGITFNEGYSISSVMAAAAHQVIAVLDASKLIAGALTRYCRWKR